ncbi:hypothetical protein BC936DRAFT_136966 [Jimgerdemannia flammicorona]|uniref:Uncharacterized protein n=1 Tax=Jimgerdemannia flammicorona TaxID=994334 RepID=A0A433CYC5_9FUNG|nr:hypothetical protein BC936DRAFT_136966 [Jimgerdemannia flammicorona]
MPSPSLPPEVLAYIFDHLVRITPNNYDLYISILGCCCVCRGWYHAALPILNGARPLVRYFTVHKFTVKQLQHLAELFAVARRYNLKLGAVVDEMEIITSELLLDNSTLVKLAISLVHSLQFHLPLLKINFYGMYTPHQLKLLRYLLQSFAKGLKTLPKLRISFLMDPKLEYTSPLRTLRLFAAPILRPTPHPFVAFIPTVGPLLTQFETLHCSLTPPLAHALAFCSHMRTVDFHHTRFHLTPDAFATLLSSWPDIQTLSIRSPHPSTANTREVVDRARSFGQEKIVELEIYDMNSYCDVTRK